MAQAMLQSSLVGELEANIEIKSPAKKFYQLFAVRPNDLPKVTPSNIHGCDVQEGEFGKVGGIIIWNYAIDGQPKMVKERIEAVDQEKNLIVLRAIEGDPLKELKSFINTIQVTPKQTGPGSVIKCHVKYERIDENVAHPEDLIGVFVKMSKDMDQMLLSQV